MRVDWHPETEATIAQEDCRKLRTLFIDWQT